MRILGIALLVAAAGSAAAADLDRGRLLYELRCGACHTESVHGRKHREAKDFDGIRGWVGRWNQTLMLGWNGEDVENVAVYLNEQYYRYKCPPEVCRVVSISPSPIRPAR